MRRLCAILLFPLGLLYGTVAWLRRRYFARWKSVYTPELPTLCVGNLSVGGTGKTPHVEYWVRHLSQRYRVAILSRGYKRTTRGYLSTSDPSVSLSARTLGDEPMQYHQKFADVQVAVCENRAEGVQRLLQHPAPPQVVVLDDAYQHLRIACGLKILLTEYASPFTHDYPLPAGNLREFRCNAQYADMVVVTKAPADLADTARQQMLRNLAPYTSAPVFFSTYQYAAPIPMTEKASAVSLSSVQQVWLLTGIANPKPLLQEVQSQYEHTTLFSFPDHHAFTVKELQQLLHCYESSQSQVGAIFTTEKDAVRLQEPELKKIVSLLPIFILPIQVKFLFGEAETLNKIIDDYVKQNERDSFVLAAKD